jgi:microcystin-dependent protein
MSAPNPPADFKAVISDPSSTLCQNFINTLLKLPVLVYKFMNWLLDDAGNVTQEFINQVIPPGCIMMYGLSSPPAGWIICNGQLLNRTTYANLFAAIGETFGAGDSSTTFAVPDMRDKFPGGVSGTVSLAATGGAVEFDLDLDHKHVLGQFDHIGGDDKYFVVNDALNQPQDATSTRQESGEGSVNTIQPYGDISPAPEGSLMATETQEYNGTETLTVPTVPPYLALNFIIKS